MNRQHESKRQLREAIKRFQEQNPERYAQLLERAKYELEHPPERPIIRATRYSLTTGKLDVDNLVLQFRAGRKHYFISTIDCWNESHLYSELLHTETEADEILTQRHPKFLERNEKLTKIEVCTCPLCQINS